MSCNEHQRRLPAFLDGTLSPEEASPLAAHLMSCDGCRAAMLSERVPQHGLPVSGPSDAAFWAPMDGAILAELDLEESAPPGGVWRWLTGEIPTRRVTMVAYAAALAAALLLALAGGGAGGEAGREASGAPAPASAARTAESAPLVPAAEEAVRAEVPSLKPAGYVPVHGSL